MALVVYFALCALGWIAAIAILFGLLKARRALRRQSPRERRPIVLLILLTFAFVGIHYVLSYPVALSRLPPAGGTALLDVYVPVEWLYDHTPLRHLLRYIGESQNVGPQMDHLHESRMRRNYWGSTPPILYAAGWLALGAAIVGSAVWTASRTERWWLRRKDA